MCDDKKEQSKFDGESRSAHAAPALRTSVDKGVPSK